MSGGIDDNGWEENKKLVDFRFNKGEEERALIIGKLDQLTKDVASLKAISSIYGALGGIITGALAGIITFFKGINK